MAIYRSCLIVSAACYHAGTPPSQAIFPPGNDVPEIQDRMTGHRRQVLYSLDPIRLPTLVIRRIQPLPHVNVSSPVANLIRHTCRVLSDTTYRSDKQDLLDFVTINSVFGVVVDLRGFEKLLHRDGSDGLGFVLLSESRQEGVDRGAGEVYPTQSSYAVGRFRTSDEGMAKVHRPIVELASCECTEYRLTFLPPPGESWLPPCDPP